MKGFTLIEVIVAILILTVGILTVSQMTILGMRSNRIVQEMMDARAILARGMESIKILPIGDPLLTPTCDSTLLDSVTLAYHADSTNVVGRAIGATVFDTYWNVADNYPNSGERTIRMMVYNRVGRRLINADYVKWR